MYRKLEEKTTGIPLFGSLEFRQDWSFAHVDILGKPREHRPKFDLDKKKCINPKMDNQSHGLRTYHKKQRPI